MIQKIGILDSGIGGVSVFKEIVKLLPDASYIYFSDSINNPYGDKTKEEIQAILLRNVSFLIQKNCKLIVLACNTATAVGIDLLRATFPDICFVGTEPAIKVIYDTQYKNSGKTLLLATKLTLSCERIQELIHKYQIDNLYVYPCVGLAEEIENRNLEAVDLYIQQKLSSFSDFSSVVLGCTHYPLVLDIFQKYFPNARFIDSSYGTAKQVARKAKELFLEMSGYTLEFVDSSSNSKKREIFDFYYLR